MYSSANKSIWSEDEFLRVMLKDTVKYQEKYGFDLENGSAWNNEADAFRHAYMQAYLTLKFGDLIAKFLGDKHEQEGNKQNKQTKAEEQMDLHNNNVGRKIGNEIKNEYKNIRTNPDNEKIKDVMAEKVIESMKKEELILDLTGRRKPKKELKTNKKDSASKSKSSGKGCVGSYSVSGYTRSDGKQVSAYTRRCGAKHANLTAEEKKLAQEKYRNKKFQDINPEEREFVISLFV